VGVTGAVVLRCFCPAKGSKNDAGDGLFAPGRQDIPHVFSNARRVAPSFEAPPSAEHLKMTTMMRCSLHDRRPEVLFSLKRASKDDNKT